MNKIKDNFRLFAQENENDPALKDKPADPFKVLEQGVYTALETYSNVHRGSGHNSIVTTFLYEQARDIVLEYLGLSRDNYLVIFCSPGGAEILKTKLKPGRFRVLSCQDKGLQLGIRVLAVERTSLPYGIPPLTGGGTTRLVSSSWIVWAEDANRYEAGTPAIINVITFARALQMIRNSGNGLFQDHPVEKLTISEILYKDELENYSGPLLLHELRKTIIGRDIPVPTAEGHRSFVNLDYAASTPAFRPVWDAFCKTLSQPVEIQQEIIPEVRKICAEVLDASLDKYEIFFTSNTTGAINLAAKSLGRESVPDIKPVILSTILEHTSNDLPWRMVPGHEVIRMKPDDEGFIDLNSLETLLKEYNEEAKHGRKRIILMAVTGASNVLGVFNDLEEISRIVHRYGVRLLVDAAQLVAHRKVEMEKWGIDYLAFSAHKVYAPFGTGVLVVRKGLLTFSSADLDLVRSSGEENAGGIAALGKALLLLKRIGFDHITDEEQSLTKYALSCLAQIKGLEIYGIKDPSSESFSRKGGVIVFSLNKIMADKLADKLSELGGIGIRSGCHCAHLLVKRLVKISPVLEQFQWLIVTLFPKLKLPGLARVSLGIGNKKEDIDILIRILNRIALQNRDPGEKDMNKKINEFAVSISQRVYS